MGGGRAETAGNLVLTLGAGLKVGQAVFQTILDALVVTHFKVQSGQVDGGPPVTTVQAVAAAQAQCARHRLAGSEEHTSELQSLMRISYAVFCLKKKKNKDATKTHNSRNRKSTHIQLNQVITI